jgi:hypothetical protein
LWLKFDLIVLKLENESDKLGDVEIIDERMARTMAPGRAKEKMKILKKIG